MNRSAGDKGPSDLCFAERESAPLSCTRLGNMLLCVVVLVSVYVECFDYPMMGYVRLGVSLLCFNIRTPQFRLING